jgi:hypothetical protein
MTLVCGDNGRRNLEAMIGRLRKIREARPDLFVAGPAFAGRYGWLRGLCSAVRN